MADEGCGEMRLLLQADLDGELRPAEAARLGAHLQHCLACGQIQSRLLALSDRLQPMPRHPASDALRARVAAAIASSAPARPPVPQTGRAFVPWASFGAGFALAASLALFLVLPGTGGLPDSVVPDSVVAAHIRALQPGHLMDVVSTDHHTVKPWFDGRLPFAPPVKDLAAEGFPLAGGRMDYLSGATTAALIYRHGPHIIDLFAWPRLEARRSIPKSGSRQGYNYLSWNEGGMALWAVSDLNPTELAAFVSEWRKG